jgi:type I restriction enzyme S subunit
MREGWKVAKLEDVAQVVNGGTPKTKVPEYWGGEHLWITPAEMGGLESPYIESSRRSLTDAGLKNSSASLLPRNSVILSTRAPIGHLVINAEPMAFNQGCRGLIPRGEAHYKYLYYFLYSSVNLLNDLGSGTTFKELSAGKLKKVEVPLPPLPEQKRIVAILDEAFAGIATAVANTEKNLANARELFESYLNAVFSQRGDGWNCLMLKEAGRLQTGSTPKTSEKGNYGNYIPFIKPGDFRPDGTVDYSNEGLSPEGAKKARTVHANSVLMVCIGATIGKTSFAEKAVTTNQQINAFIPYDGCSYKFAYYQMLSAGFQRLLLARAGQATLPIISKAKWGELPLWFPVNKAEQERIVAKLDELASAKQEVQSVYERKLVALAELKQSLLQKAFYGELTSGKEASDAMRQVEEIA